MTDFYYQIKAKDNSEYSASSWGFPPIFSGKVTAENKKQAKALIEEEYGRQFPLRVLKKDLDEHHYLLAIREIAEDDHRTRGLFETRTCQQCGTTFRQIELYNDHNETYKGAEFCSWECKNEHYEKNRVVRPDLTGNGKPVIYRILNTNTGMSYVGKTTQVFTLRWYQHFFQGGDCKFHKAVRNSSLEDWEFKILEAIEVPKGIDRDEFVAQRERHWINELDCIANGYNSVAA